MSAPPEPQRAIDGIICFGGEDWWYHNRGHYDMQMMREMSHRLPVLYINSIGMRVPRLGEGRMFLTRVRRKLKSLRRGLVEARPNFHVFSPTVLPGKMGMRASRRIMVKQIRRIAAQLGMKNPLLWVACPPGVEVLDQIGPSALVYQRTDRFESFANVNRAVIEAYDRRLKSEADVTLYCSSSLFEEERDGCRSVAFVDHGVDYDAFSKAGMHPVDPDDVAQLPRPRVGFVGGIDVHTFDPPLFVEVVKLLPDVTFVLVGGCSLPEDWCPAENVHLLGQRPYESVPAYMASCDVLIMPWNKSEWIKACNPIKLKEYLAVGRGVVTSWFDELRNGYEDLVTVAPDAASFAAAIRELLVNPPDSARLRARVADETWRKKADRVVEELAARGIHIPEYSRHEQS
ncbi:MAG: glycosyltransferase [Phycisphaerales bacterium]